MIGCFKKVNEAWTGKCEEGEYKVAAKPGKRGWRWVAAYNGKIIRKGAGVPHVIEALEYAVDAANDHFIINAPDKTTVVIDEQIEEQTEEFKVEELEEEDPRIDGPIAGCC